MSVSSRVFKPAAEVQGGRHRLLLMMAKFGHEIVLFFAAIALILIALALISHSPNDPAWSTTGTGAPIENWMQEPGAILANIVYFLFGFSSWWLYFFAWHVWLSSLRKRLFSSAEYAENAATYAVSRALLDWFRYAPLRRLRDVFMLSLLLGASTILEWGRLHRYEFWLPDHAGGVLGRLLGPWAVHFLGINGSAVLAIALLVITMAEVFKFSWLHCAEILGRILDGGWSVLYSIWQSRQDIRIGREALRHREEEPFLEPDSVAGEGGFPSTKPSSLRQDRNTDSIQGDAKNAGTDERVNSEFSDEEPRSVSDRVTAVAQTFSETQINEYLKQSDKNLSETPTSTLKPELNGADELVTSPSILSKSPVSSENRLTPIKSNSSEVTTYKNSAQHKVNSIFKPPHIDLLDLPSTQQEAFSSVVLETTSRLIEQKLKDFSVSVKVVAATPGPVVTRYEIEPALKI
jgi:S-DNA-T family DNA segregation ATPase FtsK/SpoIIIE